MAKYKLDMNDMQFPLYIETQSHYSHTKQRGIMCAKAVVFDDENEDDTRGAVYMITRVS